MRLKLLFFHPSDPDMDEFFNLVANTQRCRLDDQRVSIEVLPGLRLTSNSVQDTEVKMVAGQKPNQLGNTVRICLDPLFYGCTVTQPQ